MTRYNPNSGGFDTTKLPLTGGELSGNLTVDENIIMVVGKTVDGVDVSEIPTTYVPLSGASLTGNLNFNLASIPVATDNASAAIATVAVGGLYRSNADPSVIMIRTV